MRIGAFGFEGSYARKGDWKDDVYTNDIRSLSQHRCALSAEYCVDDWTFRSEYIHSTGLAFAKSLVNTDGSEAKDCTLSSDGSKGRWFTTLLLLHLLSKTNCMLKLVMTCTDQLLIGQKPGHNMKLVWITNSLRILKLMENLPNQRPKFGKTQL